jgi:beta-lactam-binding protein with PASTA domain
MHVTQSQHDHRYDDSVQVPDFVGQQALAAWLMGHDLGVLCQGPDPDGPHPILHGTVTGQKPPAGTSVRRWDTVTVWVEGPGDTAGVREPRRPLPPDLPMAKRREPPD